MMEDSQKEKNTVNETVDRVPEIMVLLLDKMQIPLKESGYLCGHYFPMLPTSQHIFPHAVMEMFMPILQNLTN